MSRIFITKSFYRWLRKSGLTMQSLVIAVNQMKDGLIDVDLGGYVYKKRVALPGQGKRGSTRTIIATKFAGTWFYLYGFNKNEKSNISRTELAALQKIASHFFTLSNEQLLIALKSQEIMEIEYEHN